MTSSRVRDPLRAQVGGFVGVLGIVDIVRLPPEVIIGTVEFVFRNGEIVDTARRDGLVRLVEALPEREFITRVEVAAGQR